MSLKILLFCLKPHLDKLDNSVSVIFDNRIKVYAVYYGCSNKTHLIRVSPNNNTILGDLNASLHVYLGTIIHELKHAIQSEQLGERAYNALNFRSAVTIKNSKYSDFYSVCEVEARLYELKHVLKAVKVYNKATDKIKGE